jgi:nucleotide-binding universal stress UspA family protein
MEPSPVEKVVWPSVRLETILVPTDLRPDSKVAFAFALAFAQKFEAFRIGSPFEQILREAADLKASLIVMASHCYGWFDRLV